MDDIDFKAKVTRSAFEELCADLFERVPRPVQDALMAAEMKMVSILIAFLYKTYGWCGHSTWRNKMKLFSSLWGDLAVCLIHGI